MASNEEDSSSSDSDIENYLQPFDKIDLSSSFFDTKSKKVDNILNEIVENTNLKEEDHYNGAEVAENIFKNMEDYQNQMEEAKKQIEEYNLKKKNHEEQTDTFKLLSMKENGVDFHDTSDSSASSESELEEVATQDEKTAKMLPSDNLEINVEMPEHIKHKTGQELLDSIKRRVNNIRKKNQVLIHKVHLLCWLAYGFGINTQLNSREIQSRALSLIPSQLYSQNKITLVFLEELLEWYRSDFIVSNTDYPKKVQMRTLLLAQMDRFKAFDAKMLVYIFAAILKSLGAECRLILNVSVEPLTPPKNQLHSLSKKMMENDASVSTKTRSRSVSSTKEAKTTENNNDGGAPQPKASYNLRNKGSPLSVKRRITQLDGPNDSEDEVFVRRTSLRLTKHRLNEEPNSKRSKNKIVNIKKSKSVPIPQPYVAIERIPLSTMTSSNILDKKTAEKAKRKSSNGEESEVVARRVSPRLAERHENQQSKTKIFKSQTDPRTIGSDNMTPKTSQNKNAKQKEKGTSKERKKKPDTVKDTLAAWIEVFLKKENQWITIDVINGKVDCFEDLSDQISKHLPLANYLLAFHNKTVKDLTKKYSLLFNTTLRKLRVNVKWWEATLKPYQPRQSKKEKKENEELERKQMDQPLPTYIAQYKNHPLYVLKRHLLKYEAIYPPNAPIVGFVRKEEVYPRECVYKLHPRDIWYKQAKVVKPGEKAYKIVKGRPRWDKLSRQIVTDPTEDIFGPWQVEDYNPPTAENGIVPKNAYGNVELFKPSMLPKKTVHLQLPGLNKIAKQMNIDCPSAVVGFEYTGGWIHPSYDGFVVCEEFEDILVAAWELNEDELDRQEEEKMEKRVYGNWKKLIKGLLIRQRLNAKYKFGNAAQDSHE